MGRVPDDSVHTAGSHGPVAGMQGGTSKWKQTGRGGKSPARNGSAKFGDSPGDEVSGQCEFVGVLRQRFGLV